MNTHFPSKIDGWLLLVLTLAPMVALAAGVLVYTMEGHLVGFLPAAIVLLIYVGLVFPMSYEVTPEALVIRFGLARSRVAYADIRSVTPTGNPISSPALSLDRLFLDTGRSKFGPNISPADKSHFLDALATRTPHLVRRGDSLVPRD